MENLRVERTGDGKVSVSFVATLPPASLEENPKYPFTPWNQKEAGKLVGKACDRLAQAIANSDYVAERVGSRTASKAEERDQRKVERLNAELTAAQARIDSRGNVPQVEGAAPAPSLAVTSRARTRRSKKGGR